MIRIKCIRNIIKVCLKCCEYKFEQMILLLVIIPLMLSISLQFYESIQDLGKYPQYEMTLLIVLVILISDKLINKYIKNIRNNK